MDSLLKISLDYVYFFYGLSFIILGVVAFSLERQKKNNLSWIYLSSFGFLHGITEWLDLLTLSFFADSRLNIIRLLFLAMSFLCLIEFARSGIDRQKRKSTIWIYPVIAAAVSCGYFFGIEGLMAFSRYFIGFTGSLWTAYILFKFSKIHKNGSILLKSASAGFLLYAFLSGLISSKDIFLPASIINTENFYLIFKLPVQLFRGIIALFISGAIWIYYSSETPSKLLEAKSRKNGLIIISILLVQLISGWILTNAYEKYIKNILIDQYVARAEIASSSINLQRLKTLSVSEKDLDNIYYHRLKEIFISMKANSEMYRFLYLMTIKDGRIVFIADSEVHNSKDLSPPGQIYEEAASEIYDVFKNGRTLYIYPMKDRWGEFLSVFSPVKESGTVAAVIGLDVDTKDWNLQIYRYRLIIIIINLLISIVIIFSGIIIHREIENSEIVTVSERRLQRVLDITNDGVWDWDIKKGEVYFSKKWCESLGYSAGEVTYQIDFWKSIIHHDDLNKTNIEIEKHLNRQTPYYYIENRLRKKNGDYRYNRDRGLVVEWDNDGSPLKMTGSSTDVTVERELLNKLNEQNNFFETIIESIPSPFYYKDKTGKYLGCNSLFAEFIGLDKNDIIDKTTHDINPKELADIYNEMDLKLIENPYNQKYESRMKKNNGETRDVIFNKRVYYDENENPAGIIGIIADITDRKLMEQEIRESREFYKSFFDNNNAIKLIIDPENEKIIEVNRAACDFYGYPKEKFITMKISDINILAPGQIYKKMQASLRLETVHHLFKHRLADGGIRDVEVYTGPVVFKDRTLLFSIIHDITSRIEAENRFKTILDALPGFAFLKDKRGMYIAANKKFCDTFNVLENEIYGKHDNVIFPHEISSKYSEEDMMVYKTGEEFSTDEKILINGEYHYISTKKVPIRDAAGNITGIVGLGFDISDRYEIENKLMETIVLAEEFHQMFEISHDMLAIFNLEGKFIEFNGSWEKTLGWSADELKTRFFIDFVLPEDKSATIEFFEKMLDTGYDSSDFENRYICKDGSYKWISWKSNISLSDGKIYAVARDVSNKKIIESELISARENSEKANRLKSLFLAKMSHEIRTPMNAILGMTDLALQYGTDFEQIDYLLTIKESADYLLDIINDILDFSKIEAGKLELTPVNFNLHLMLNSVVRLMQVRFDEKNIKFELGKSSDLPDFVNGDELRIRQILINLLGNALKFTEKGFISLSVSYYDIKTPDGYRAICFSVEDSGIGILKHEQENIFENYTRAGENSGKIEGAGLGLAITKQLVEMMNGKIWVESEAGKGSKFKFYIVLKTVIESEKETLKKNIEIPEIKNKKLKVLLAEDNSVNIKLAVAVLSKYGHDVTVAENGSQAVEILKNSNFDLLLMDIEMPVMGGLEASMLIRNGEAGIEKKSIPIIAMSAHSSDEFYQKCKDAGMNDYISKPIRINDLNSIINKVLSEI